MTIRYLSVALTAMLSISLAGCFHKEAPVKPNLFPSAKIEGPAPVHGEDPDYSGLAARNAPVPVVIFKPEVKKPVVIIKKRKHIRPVARSVPRPVERLVTLKPILPTPAPAAFHQAAPQKVVWPFPFDLIFG